MLGPGRRGGSHGFFVGTEQVQVGFHAGIAYKIALKFEDSMVVNILPCA